MIVGFGWTVWKLLSISSVRSSNAALIWIQILLLVTKSTLTFFFWTDFAQNGIKRFPGVKLFILYLLSSGLDKRFGSYRQFRRFGVQMWCLFEYKHLDRGGKVAWLFCFSTDFAQNGIKRFLWVKQTFRLGGLYRYGALFLSYRGFCVFHSSSWALECFVKYFWSQNSVLNKVNALFRICDCARIFYYVFGVFWVHFIVKIRRKISKNSPVNSLFAFVLLVSGVFVCLEYINFDRCLHKHWWIYE